MIKARNGIVRFPRMSITVSLENLKILPKQTYTFGFIYLYPHHLVEHHQLTFHPKRLNFTFYYFVLLFIWILDNKKAQET
jgi:hypothetical protein